MMHPFIKTTISLAAAVALLAGAELNTGTAPLITHEWGTFTSVAREDGAAVEWAPLLEAQAIYLALSLAQQEFTSRSRGAWSAWRLPFCISTPSIPPRFPFMSISPRDWSRSGIPALRRDPTRASSGRRYNLEYPTTEGASHYYAARNTNAAPLRVGDQQEKMIFYRGLGYFEPPLHARYVSEGKLDVLNAGSEPIPFVVAFENQNGRIGFRIAENVTGLVTTGLVTTDAPDLKQDLAAIRDTMVARLIKLGLYPKEALAMMDTWKDSWFTEGARVFYIVPRATVDSLLLLTIVPPPAEVQRVFVGRLEVLSPWTKDTIEHALRAGDDATLTAFGRFLEPFITQIQRADKGFVLSSAAQSYLRAIAGGSPAGGGYGPAPDPASCVQ